MHRAYKGNILFQAIVFKIKEKAGGKEDCQGDGRPQQKPGERSYLIIGFYVAAVIAQVHVCRPDADKEIIDGPIL